MATSPSLPVHLAGACWRVGDRDNPVVVQAFVNGEGRVYDYTIVSGNADSKTRSQVEDTLLFSVFAPAQVFGQPVRGTVILSFAEVAVHGYAPNRKVGLVGLV
jgi:hypothetical protein